MINDVELAGTRAPFVKSLDHHESIQSMDQWLAGLKSPIENVNSALQSSNPGEELLDDFADIRGPDGTLDGDWRMQ